MKTAFCIDCSGSMSDAQARIAADFVRAHLREGDLVYAYDSDAWELDANNIFVGWKKCGHGGTDATAVVSLARESGAERLVNISDLQMHEHDLKKFNINVHVDLLGLGPRYDHLELPVDLAQPLPDIRKS